MTLNGERGSFGGKRIFTSLIWTGLALAVSSACAETVTIRSGNGFESSPVRSTKPPLDLIDTSVTFLQGPANSDFQQTFTTSSFSSAQSDLPAHIQSGLGVDWLPSLTEDSSAHWIGTNANAYEINGSGTTALYAVSFAISKSFASATLTMHYAVDDNLGGINAGGVNAGVYLNGTAICSNSTPIGTFAAEQTFTCDVSSALTVGRNWLYLDAVNLQGAAGLLFSATISTVPPSPPVAPPANQTETLTVRSGNGSVGGRDTAVTFLQGPANTDFTHAFTQGDFSSAQRGPAAYILNRNPLFIAGLSNDATAKWIGTNASATISQANTALYAVNFTIQSAFTFATLNLHYAVDNALGGQNNGGPNDGVYLNGVAVCAGLVDNGITDFTQEHVLTCDVSSQLSTGTNWLYLDAVDLGSATGLLFSATITATNVIVPSINQGGVVNSASSSAPVAAGSLATVYGGFPITTPMSAAGLPLWPLSMSGLSLQFNGIQAPLAYVSGELVSLQIPWEVAGQTQVPGTAASGTYTSTSQAVNLAPYAPGIFSINAQGTGQGAILDGSYQLVNTSNPATAGTTIVQIYCTGLGPVTNQPATGALAPTDTLSMTITTPTVTIGGSAAQVLFSGLVPGGIGLYQVNALVPSGVSAGPSVPVNLSIVGVASNTVTVAVGPLAPVPNPQPSITSLSPASFQAGSGAEVQVTIHGTGFTSASSVTFNGLFRPAAFASSIQIYIVLLVSDLATAGNYPIVVTNPAPGGGASNAVNFGVTTPPPPPVTNLAGPWTGTWSASLGARGTVTANLSQSGTELGGAISFASWCFSSASIAGTISGNNVSLNLTFTGGQKVSFSGGTNAPGTAITGPFTITSGSCIDGSTGGLALGR